MKTRVKVSRVMCEKAVKAVLGPKGRVWVNKDSPTHTYSIGEELNPGRIVHGSGPTLLEAWSDAFLDQDAIKAEAARIEALRASKATPLPNPSEPTNDAHIETSSNLEAP